MNKKFFHGVYCGPVKEWHGEGALLREDCLLGQDIYMAQFDNLERFGKNRLDKGFGWHPQLRSHFKDVRELSAPLQSHTQGGTDQ